MGRMADDCAYTCLNGERNFWDYFAKQYNVENVTLVPFTETRIRFGHCASNFNVILTDDGYAQIKTTGSYLFSVQVSFSTITSNTDFQFVTLHINDGPSFASTANAIMGSRINYINRPCLMFPIFCNAGDRFSVNCYAEAQVVIENIDCAVVKLTS